MATITADNIASVSLKDADRDPDGFAQKLGKSFEEYGFAIIADHGIPDDLIHRAEDKAKAFFALPEDVKRKYLIPGGGGARGYTPFGIETAKGAAGARPQGILARRPRPAAGPQVPRPHAATTSGRPRSPSFKDTFLELFATFDRAGPEGPEGHRALPEDRRGLFRGRGARRQFGPARCSTIRRRPSRPASTSAPARTRTSTRSPCCSAPRKRGSSCTTRDGRWIPVSPQPGELVINIGDMLQRLTNGVLRSTTHRVVNPTPDRASKARYSMPFFLHFRSDFLIEALPGDGAAGEQPKWPPITANDYLQERLREIKLV